MKHSASQDTDEQVIGQGSAQPLWPDEVTVRLRLEVLVGLERNYVLKPLSALHSTAFTAAPW